MNSKLITYRKQLEDEILNHNNKAYGYKELMKEHEKKAKEAQEILDLLNKGKKYIDYEKTKEGLNGLTS